LAKGLVRVLPNDISSEIIAFFTRNSLFTLQEAAFGAEEALAVLREEDETVAPICIVASALASLHVARTLKAVVGTKCCTTVAAVAVRVVVLVVAGRHTRHVFDHVAWVAGLSFAIQRSRRRVCNPLAPAVLKKTLRADRAWCEGIEVPALRTLLPLLACSKVAVFAQEALVLLPEVHKARVASYPAAVLNAVHARLEAIVWTNRFSTVASVAIKVLMLLVADHVAELGGSIFFEACIAGGGLE